MKKKILSAILAGMFALGSFSISDAMSREEISAIKVSKSGNFAYWEKNSPAKEKLVAYVKDVTDKKSKNFIPIEDRIAVFDMDGTFLCETAPYYFEWMLYLERALYDENFTPSQKDLDYAKIIEKAIRETKQFPKNVDIDEQKSQDSVFIGMTPAEYKNYIENFMKKPVEGLTNLKWGEAFYLPMVEVIKYLEKNDFTVYVVSGTDREICRVLIGDIFGIPKNQVIGSDAKILSNNQDDVDGLRYKYTKDDYLIRGEFVIKNLQMNKTSAIYREIGKQPVLAFGNSGGDLSMINYTINHNKYKSLGFFVICDDTDREFGKPKRAVSDTELAKNNGWQPISMRNDWKTIYGDDVKLEK